MGKERQEWLPGGIEKFSRSAMYKKKGAFKKLGKPVAAKTSAGPSTKTKQIGGASNGGSRTVATVKEQRYYPTVDVVPRVKKTKVQKPAKFRASLKPGTVCILLAGKFKGKRVVLLATLPSGLILVSGPFNVNGVPLKRVDPAYVIATSTQVDISGVKLPAEVNDGFFARPAAAGGKGEIFDNKEDKGNTLDPKRAALQKEVDGALGKAISGTPLLRDYLRAPFSLRSGQYPHEMKF